MTAALPSKLLPPGHATPAGWQARLVLDYSVRADAAGSRTIQRTRHRTGPLAVQKALYPEGGVCHTLLLHPPGGLVGGDGLRLDATLAPGAHVLVTTPGAGKWYRCPRALSRFDQHLTVSPGATLEYLPQEAIVFDGARGRGTLNVDLAGDARFVGWDIVVLGRAAGGLPFATGRLEQHIAIHHDGQPLIDEHATYTGGDRLLDSPIGLAGRRVVGSLYATGPNVSQALAAVRATLAPAEGDLAAASAWMVLNATVTNSAVSNATFSNAAGSNPAEVLVVRVLGDCSQRARRILETAWAALREHWLGLTPCPPRIWLT